MFKYNGYVIKTRPDYKEALKKGVNIEELVCDVYEETDSEFKNSLLNFNMMPCFDYRESTVSEIEIGIKKMIDLDCEYLKLKVNQKKFDRQSELFYRAVQFIKESMGGNGVEMTLKLCLGMTDEEIKETFDGLNESEESQEIKML